MHVCPAYQLVSIVVTNDEQNIKSLQLFATRFFSLFTATIFFSSELPWPLFEITKSSYSKLYTVHFVTKFYVVCIKSDNMLKKFNQKALLTFLFWNLSI